MKKRDKKSKDLIKKPLKVGAICGILLIVMFIISIIVSSIIELNAVYSIIYSILFYAFLLLFFYGFYVLGKRYKNKMLKVVSLIFIIFYIISFLIFGVFGFAMDGYGEELQQKMDQIGINESSENLTEDQAQAVMDELLPLVLPIIIFVLIYGVLLLVVDILFGVGLIKLGKNVKHAKMTGILEIIGSGSLLLIVGLLFGAGLIILLIAHVFKIVILFNESKKAKE